MEKQTYYDNKPIGTYIFIAVFCLTIIVRVEPTLKMTWVDVFLAVMYGGMIYGIANAIWYGIGDIVTQRLLGTYIDEEESVPEIISPAPALPIDQDFLTLVKQRINDGKFWAKGMVQLDSTEEAQLYRYFKQRWEASNDNPLTDIPMYVDQSLIDKLTERGVSDGVKLTEYGETVIPIRPIAQ